jgi:hypothetical protein
MSLRIACKNPDCPRHGKPFTPQRAGAQYCSNACRTAAYRLRHAPAPVTWWREDNVPEFSTRPSRARNSDGTPALTRGELAKRLLRIATTDDDGASKTGRRYYYLALSHGYIQPDMSDTPEGKKSRDAAYDRVTAVLGILRKQDRLDWGMVLDLTRELTEWPAFTSPREAREYLRRIYDEDRWLGQPHFPVFIVEKDTMVPVCEPMAQKWQMPFASSRGYGSLKLQHDAADLMRRRYAKMMRRQQEETGAFIIVYFVSDLDPSGIDLQRAWEEALTAFGVRFQLVRIGLTREQVANLRNARLRAGIEVKHGDSRARAYIAQYGSRCWEADILPATVIEQALDDHVRGWLDGKLWRRRDAEIERARSLL